MNNDFKKQFIKIIGQSVIISGLAIILIIFLTQKISRESKDLTAKRSSFVVWENRGERLLILQDGYKKVENDIPRLAVLLPTEDQLINFLSSLENIAIETNNKQSFNFIGGINPASENEPKSINFTLTLQGDINTFIAYLKKIQTIPYFVKITNINITGNQGLNNQSQINLLGKVYLR